MQRDLPAPAAAPAADRRTANCCFLARLHAHLCRWSSPAAHFRSLCALLLFAAGVVGQANVLVIVADDFGIDCAGCYGTGLNGGPTPNLDALAANGVRFTRAYVNPACSPTRGCLMTGRYGFRNGVPTTIGAGDPGLNMNEVLLPVALQGTGYAPALIGKWHLGSRFSNNTPNAMGWPHFVGIIDSGVFDYSNWAKVVNGVPGRSTNYITTDLVDEALAFVNQRTTPWMVMLTFNAPHQPFHAPPAHLHTRNLAGLDPATTPAPFQAAMIEAMDREIGRLLSGMSSTARANTNILFLGDNGTDGAVAPIPYRSDRVKGSLYDGGIRVPLIVSGPAVAAPGRTSAALVSVVDVFPTVLELCGRPAATLPPSPAGPLDGVSFVPILANTAASVRSYVYSEMYYSPFGGGYVVTEDQYALLRVLRTGRQRQELYRIDLDPLQTTDLLQTQTAQPQGAADTAAFQRLSAILDTLHPDAWVEGIGTSCSSPSVPTVELSSVTMPTLGRSFVLQVAGMRPEATGIFFAVGWSNHTASSLGTLPLALDPWGMTGCSAYTFPDIFWLLLPNIAPYGGYYPVWLPNLLVLDGIECNVQSFVVDAAANPAGVLATNAQHLVLGR